MGIAGQQFTNRKVMTIARKDRQIAYALQQREKPTSLSYYSLPKDYKSASFDYNVLIVRSASHTNYISTIINLADYENDIAEDIIELMIPYIDFECGEIYEMDKEEVPLIYAAGANRINGFKTHIHATMWKWVKCLP